MTIHRISDMGLDAATVNLLLSLGITSSDELEDRTRDEVRAIHGIGPKRLEAIEKAMSDRGLSFAAEPKKKSVRR